MSEANKVQLTKAQEIQQLEEQREAAAKRLKELKKNGVSYKQVETKKGLVGMTINGMGVPKFFYKEHLLSIVADTPEAEARREEIRQWVAEHVELTDKQD